MCLVNKKKGRFSAGGFHISGPGKGINQGKSSSRKCGEAVLSLRPGDSVRQLVPLHQSCPSS